MSEEMFRQPSPLATTISTIYFSARNDPSRERARTPGPPSSPSSAGPPLPYKFASVERLVHRQKIYDTGGLPVMAHFDDAPIHYTYSLSQQRTQFFSQDGNVATTQAPTVNLPTNITSNLNNFSANPSATTNFTSKTSAPVITAKDMPVKEGDNYVGFANLPNQIYRKTVKKGFEFNLMVVGEAGLGKSTLMNSMFLTDIYSNEYPGPSLRPKKTVQVESTKVLLNENGVNLKLTVVDTPGFGDAVDNSECWQPIIDFIESKYEEYLNAESRVHRSAIPDSRVHCCLYFIAPSGHGLKPLDIEFMKRLHDKVNIIPLLAKADTMTAEECALFKRTILSEINRNKIKMYEFPDCEDEEERKLQKRIRERVPFAVVGSNTIIEANGKRVRGRKYPWGVAEVENLEHCDFLALRNMLIRTHMYDLKDVANNVHYENYRSKKLAAVTNSAASNNAMRNVMPNKNPLAQMEEERKLHDEKMKKMEKELEQVFESKVKEKMQKLKDSEVDLQRRHEQMKKSLEAQRKDLEEKWKVLESEKASFEAINKDDENHRGGGDFNNQDAKEKKKEKKKGIFQ